MSVRVPSPRRLRAARALGVVLAVAALTVPVRADEAPAPMGTEARAHFDAASAAFASKDYAAAARSLEAARRAEPHPDVLYALGQALRLNGNCAGAVDAYRDFLRSKPPEAEAELATRQLQRCRVELARSAPPPERTAPIRQRTPKAPSTTLAAPARKRASWVPFTLATSGSVLLLASAAMAAAAELRSSATGDASTLGAYRDARDDAELLRPLAIGGVVGGAALLLAAWGFAARTASTEPTQPRSERAGSHGVSFRWVAPLKLEAVW